MITFWRYRSAVRDYLQLFVKIYASTSVYITNQESKQFLFSPGEKMDFRFPRWPHEVHFDALDSFYLSTETVRWIGLS